MNTDYICEYCLDNEGLKTDSQGKVICADCLKVLMVNPTVRLSQGVSRNDPCRCGSGLKRKRCCKGENREC